jgi:hypothetical protein
MFPLLAGASLKIIGDRGVFLKLSVLMSLLATVMADRGPDSIVHMEISGLSDGYEGGTCSVTAQVSGISIGDELLFITGDVR